MIPGLGVFVSGWHCGRSKGYPNLGGGSSADWKGRADQKGTSGTPSSTPGKTYSVRILVMGIGSAWK